MFIVVKVRHKLYLQDLEGVVGGGCRGLAVGGLDKEGSARDAFDALK